MTYDRNKLEVELIRDEGERFKVYLDTAKPPKRTIGVGRNLDANGTTPLTRTVADVIKNGINVTESKLMLDHDIDTAAAALDKHIPWWRAHTDARQRVLLNMCFNMGWGTLSQFGPTLNLICTGRYGVVAAHMKASAWAREVGDRAKRLQAMMIDG